MASMVKPWHIIVLVVILIRLFGAKRLPDAARSLGRSLRIIKAETRGLAEDDLETKAEPRSRRLPLPTGDDEPSPLDDQVHRRAAIGGPPWSPRSLTGAASVRGRGKFMLISDHRRK